MSQVRVVSDEDVEDLVRLNRDVQALHATLYPNDFKQHADAEALRSLLIGLMADQAHVLAVHRNNGEAKGYVWFEVQERLETALTPAGRRIYIHHIAVSEAYRRRGVASELIQWAEEYGASKGIHQVLLDHWIANGTAQAFFTGCGFSPLRIIMRKETSRVREGWQPRSG